MNEPATLGAVASLEEFLQIQRSPPRSFDDLGVVFCLYPWLQPRDGACVVHWPGKRSHGTRWGMSDCYDPALPHYCVPAKVLLAAPPAPQFFVTGAQNVDSILDPLVSIPIIEKHRNFKLAESLGARAIEAAPQLPEILDVFSRALPPPRWEHPTYGARFEQMMHYLVAHPQPACRMWSLRQADMLIGFQVSWQGEGELMQAFRFVVPEFHKISRVLDHAILKAALGEKQRVNIGDAYRMPGLMHFKLSLGPVELRGGLHVLPHAEPADYEA